MAKKISNYIDTRNLKITYFLGAGASNFSIPIQKKLGKSIIEVAQKIHQETLNNDYKTSNKYRVLLGDENIQNFSKRLKYFGEKAIEYGSIDIYARRLYLLNNFKELHELKFCLSVFLDLWERFFHENFTYELDISYDKIDKRYLGLLSVLLEKGEYNPKLNSRVSFISWNYDLQVEMAYRSFMKAENNSLQQINKYFKFYLDDIENLQIVHLNGFRGIYRSEKQILEFINEDEEFELKDYLLILKDNHTLILRNQMNVEDSIKYAWEANEKIIEYSKKVMRETNVLIIVGYSFPSFNRMIDSQLISEFEKNDIKWVIYQDPQGNLELIESLFRDAKIVTLEKDNLNQFHIPHEFLFPSKGEKMVF